MHFFRNVRGKMVMTGKKSKKKNFLQRMLLVMTTVLFMITPIYVQAAETKILSTLVFDGDIYIYIRGVSELQQDSVVQIGNHICQREQISLASMSDSGISIRTLVLIDNSKSIPVEYHDEIRSILEGLISSSAENEQFRIGIFSDSINYLCEYSNNKENLNSVIQGITYNDQNTYLSDSLYNVISELKEEETNVYTRLLIFADGADDNTIGFTNDEVRSYIADNAYPVYTVGIPAKNNASKLEIMFSFSRATNAEYFLLDGNIQNEEIISSLSSDRSGICLKISPEESLKDGSTKKILLKLKSAEGDTELTASVNMPFGSGITETPEVDEEPEEEPDTGLPMLQPRIKTEERQENDTSGKVSVLLIILITGAALIISAAVILIVLHKKKKQKDILIQNSPVPVKAENATETGDETIISGMGADIDDARGLWKESSANYLILQNLDNTNIMMKVPIVDRVRIGRGKTQDIVIENDKKVSREHCVIILRGELMYITDCNSSNGTFYEGVTVYDETPIVSGGKIGIGAHWYRVELVRQ